jgi:hypothetical protein
VRVGCVSIAMWLHGEEEAKMKTAQEWKMEGSFRLGKSRASLGEDEFVKDERDVYFYFIF